MSGGGASGMSTGRSTWTALATVADEASGYALAADVEDQGATGVGVFEIEDGSGRWEVGGYFLDRPDEVALALLAAAHGARPFAVSEIADRDWVAQVRRELTPVRAGRVVVYGRHDRAGVPVNAIGLEIEAAMAFGTGHHGTTEGCLLAMDGLKRKGWRAARVADLGSGTGVLAMAAVRLWPARAIAGDIDPVAVATTRANARANGCAARIRTVRAAGTRHPAFAAFGRADLILANILARPLKRLAPEIRRRAAPGGFVILSGLLRRQIRDVESVFSGHGLRPVRRIDRRGWATLVLRAPGDAKQKARP